MFKYSQHMQKIEKIISKMSNLFSRIVIIFLKEINLIKMLHRLYIDKSKVEQNIWGTDGYHVGIDFTKGFFYTHFRGQTFTSLSSDGINHIIDNKYESCYLINMLLVRLIALICTLIYFIIAPFSILLYLFYAIVSLVIFICLLPIQPCATNKISEIFWTAGRILIGSIVAILTIITLLLLSPVHIIFPEFTVKILRVHKWGWPLEYCLTK